MNFVLYRGQSYFQRQISVQIKFYFSVDDLSIVLNRVDVLKMDDCDISTLISFMLKSFETFCTINAGVCFCYLIVIAAVSLATFVTFLMVFLLETALQEGIPLHKLEHSLVSGYFWGRNICVCGWGVEGKS